MSYRREYSVGGLIPEGPEVPFTKEDPASRINPYTGEPYQEDERTGFNEGGISQEALRSGVRPGEYRLMLRTKEDMDNLNNFASSFKTATESRKLEPVSYTTSDAADERSSVVHGCPRTINNTKTTKLLRK